MPGGVYKVDDLDKKKATVKKATKHMSGEIGRKVKEITKTSASRYEKMKDIK
jgi:hypothetical protein